MDKLIFKTYYKNPKNTQKNLKLSTIKKVIRNAHGIENFKCVAARKRGNGRDTKERVALHCTL